MPPDNSNSTDNASSAGPKPSLYTDTPAIALQVSQGLVVASIQVDLVDSVLERFRDDLLQRLHKTGCSGVIFDLSGLDTLDGEEFNSLRSIVAMVKIMGAESVLVGLQPGVVSALIETGADVDGLLTALDLDAAFAHFQPSPESEVESDTDSLEQGESPTDSEAAPQEQP